MTVRWLYEEISLVKHRVKAFSEGLWEHLDRFDEDKANLGNTWLEIAYMHMRETRTGKQRIHRKENPEFVAELAKRWQRALCTMQTSRDENTGYTLRRKSMLG